MNPFVLKCALDAVPWGKQLHTANTVHLELTSNPNANHTTVTESWITSFMQHKLPLGEIHTLILPLTHLRDVSELGTVHTLYFNGIGEVVDVAWLSTVHTLELDTEIYLFHLSCLGNVHTLTLRGCIVSGSDFISNLNSVHTLRLFRCNSVSNLAALRTVHSLLLWGCNEITSVSDVKSVHTLALGMLRVSDLSPITTVHSLFIEPFYQNVSTIRYVKEYCDCVYCGLLMFAPKPYNNPIPVY